MENYILGVDLGGMSAKAAVLSNGKLFGKSCVKTSAENTAEDTAHSLSQLCKSAAESAGIPFEKVKAIGIASPGVIDNESGTVISWSNYGWKEVPLAALVQKYSGKCTFVTNDANGAALGEAKFGAGKRFSQSLLVTIGTGIGGGIVLDGKLFEGFCGAGAEIGHMVIRQNGEPCTCGRKGCYERYASARALVGLTREAMKENKKSALWKFASLETVDGKTAFLAAAEQDKSAQGVLSEYIANLGEGIVNLVNLLRPQAVIIGGGVSAEKDALIRPLKEFVYPRLYVSEKRVPLEICCAELGNDAGIYGAAHYAFKRTE